MATNLITGKELQRYKWVPFCLPETRLQPGVEQTVSTLTLLPGQRATLAWLSVHVIRILVLRAVPVKLNPAYDAVYAGLFGTGATRLAGPPGQPLVYAGTDLPGTIGHFPPHQAWPIDEPDTYAVFAINNLTNPPVDASVTGSWLVHL
jgi:hypothetical protein